MKILHTVEFYYPSKGGAQEVVRQLSERLVSLGHDVTVATTRLPGRSTTEHNGVKIAEFDISGNAVRGYTGKDVKKYQKFLLESDFDVIMNYAAQQWATDIFFEVIDKVSAAKVLFPCGFSGLYNPDYKDYFKKMPDILKKYNATLYNSDDYRDINFARQHKVKNAHLIPNGAGADEFSHAVKYSIRKKLGLPPDCFLLFLVGSHTGIKGHVEAIKIFEKAKIKNAALIISANDMDGGCSKICKRKALASRFLWRYIKDKKYLIIKDLPRQDVIATYQQSDIFLFPSNIEASPLVLFEAMASKLPFLVTNVGNSAEIIKWSGGGKLLPTTFDEEGYSHADIVGAVEIVEDWYESPDKAEKIGEQGYKAWEKDFAWEGLVKKYEAICRKVVKQ